MKKEHREILSMIKENFVASTIAFTVIAMFTMSLIAIAGLLVFLSDIFGHVTGLILWTIIALVLVSIILTLVERKKVR